MPCIRVRPENRNGPTHAEDSCANCPCRLPEIYPDLHVYHYANYEVAALRRLTDRHGVVTAEVEELIEAGVL